jgi:hypothetical protein
MFGKSVTNTEAVREYNSIITQKEAVPHEVKGEPGARVVSGNAAPLCDIDSARNIGSAKVDDDIKAEELMSFSIVLE